MTNLLATTVGIVLQCSNGRPICRALKFNQKFIADGDLVALYWSLLTSSASQRPLNRSSR